MSFNLIHPENKSSMLLTFDVSKLLKSNKIILEHPSKKDLKLICISLKTILIIYFPSFLKL